MPTPSDAAPRLAVSLLLVIAPVLVFGAIMVLGFHITSELQDAAHRQACEKIAAGEQSPELLPVRIDCPAP